MKKTRFYAEFATTIGNFNSIEFDDRDELIDKLSNQLNFGQDKFILVDNCCLRVRDICFVRINEREYEERVIV